MKKIILLFLTILTDIFSKYWTNLTNPEYSFLGGLVGITHVKNTGVAFGTPLPGIEWIIPIILVAISIFLWKSWGKFKNLEKIGYLIILAGGFLNAIERTLFGSVTDFIAIKYFAVFNIADIAITCGVIVLFYTFIQEKK